MINAACPRCKDETEHKLVILRTNRDLLWCQKCFHIRLDKWDFCLPLEPMQLHAELSVHVEVLDADHIHLMDFLNYISTLEGDKEALTKEGNTLLRLTVEHFNREDTILKKYNYPDLKEHNNRHGIILRKMQKNIDMLARAHAKEFSDIIFALKCCLIDLLEDDMKYKHHLNS